MLYNVLTADYACLYKKCDQVYLKNSYSSTVRKI